MENKSIQKSIRITDEVNQLIESQPGKSFNDKLDSLIWHCVFEMDEVNAQLRRVREDIDRERQYLRVLRESKELLQQNVKTINTRLLTLLPAVDQAYNVISGLEVLGSE